MKTSQMNYRNYELTSRLISSGFSSICSQLNVIADFINGDIQYLPFIPEKTTLNVSSAHRLGVVNGYTLEYNIERYRMLHYKRYPSRLSCLYAFGDYESCVKVSKWYDWDINKVKKFEISKDIMQSTFNKAIKVCKCNMEIITHMWNEDVAFYDNNDMDLMAEAYWSGKGMIQTSNQNIRTGRWESRDSDILYEYLIEGILDEVKNDNE
ncbi:MAG: hypothetical protein K6D97_02905 [Clostridia bacterium]|nr:hypothetical protein [Clostridia bacterium]